MLIAELIKQFIPLKLKCLVKNIIVYKLYWCQTLSQAGQDYWVINEAFLKKRNGYFVEIGSADGVHINNTCLLEKRYNWSGICIEPNPLEYQRLRLNRSCICLNMCVDHEPGEVEFAFAGMGSGILDKDTDLHIYRKEKASSVCTKKLKTTTLYKILETHNAPKIIDYLSVDVEGAEERILGNFPFDKYRFLTMTIERPSSRLHEKLVSQGYILAKFIPGLDSFYLHESFQDRYTKNLMKYYGWNHQE